MRCRTLAAVILCALLTAASYSQTTQKDPPKDKELTRGPTKVPEEKYPKVIDGKDVDAWVKLMVDPDPAVRERAILVLPNFGPDVRKHCTKEVIARMRMEPDPGVKIALFNLVGAMGFEKQIDVDAAVMILANTANQREGALRLHAVQTLGMFGHKAHKATESLVGPPILDPSYEIRRAVAHTLGRIASSETTGPTLRALSVLAGNLAKDPSTVVRLEALQSLVLLGSPWAETRKEGDKNPPKFDVKNAEATVAFMKTRIGNAKTKGTETDKQIELWCRLVLIRFDAKELNDDNLSAITSRLADPELAVKLQALQILSLVGEGAARKIDAVVKLLDDRGRELTLMPPLRDVGGIPSSGKNLIILANVENVLHFRIFDRDGNKVVNVDETKLTPQIRQITSLKKQLENLWPPHKLTEEERSRLLTALAPIVGNTHDNEQVLLQVSALQTLTAMGEKADPARPAIVKLLKDENVPPAVMLASLNALAAMGVGARPCLPDLEQLKVRLNKLKEERINDPDFRKAFEDLKPEQKALVTERLPEEQFKRAVDDTIKYINASKLGNPGGVTTGSDAKTP